MTSFSLASTYSSVLQTLQSVQDAQNYAFYLPPTSSSLKGTFLDEQLTFEDYTLLGHVPILEVSVIQGLVA